MYIKQLSITNYRNFGTPAFSLELRPFTLILGENNVGKTNLLNALSLLFSQDISVARRRVLEIDDINYAAVRVFKQQVADPAVKPEDVVFPEVVIEATLTGMNKDQEAVVGDWFSNTDLTEAKVTYHVGPRAAFNRTKWIDLQRQAETPATLVDFPIAEYRYTLFGGNDATSECDAYFLRMLKAECLDALRDAQRELIASGDYRLLYRILNQASDTQYAEIRKQLQHLEKAVKDDPHLKTVRDEMAKLLDRVSLQTSTADNSIDFSFSSPEASEMLKKISLLYGSNPINVERNGLGRNNLLYICLVLSHLARNSTNSNTVFRVVGIEEPEAHLHPHLQDHLAANIESIQGQNGDSMQLLLTSHSTHIAAKLKLANTVVIYEDPSTKRASSHYVLTGLDEQQDENTIRYLSMYLDATKSRMFFARKLILVEGISEQILLPKLFEIHVGSTLEKHGVTVVNVNGVAFRHFLQVVKNGYFVKTVVLTDSDTGTRTESRADDLKKDFNDGRRIFVASTTTSTLEKELVQSNSRGSGKVALLSALKATKPISGKQFAEATGANDLEPEAFFAEVERYKAEFAFSLHHVLTSQDCQIVIPEYIRNALDFLGCK